MRWTTSGRRRPRAAVVAPVLALVASLATGCARPTSAVVHDTVPTTLPPMRDEAHVPGELIYRAAGPGGDCNTPLGTRYPTHWTRQTERQDLPDDFVPVRLVSCGTETRRLPDGTEWTWAVQLEATQGLSSVVARIRHPVDPGLSGNCVTVLIADPWFLLVDASGRAVVPITPHESHCGTPVDVGFGGLHYTRTKALRLRQEETAMADGCWPDWKYEPWYAATSHQGEPYAREKDLGGATPTRVCAYRSNGTDGGAYLDGASPTGAAAKELAAAMVGPGATTASCPAAPKEFAVVALDGDFVYVELTDCQRLWFRGDEYTGSAPKAAAAVKALLAR